MIVFQGINLFKFSSSILGYYRVVFLVWAYLFWVENLAAHKPYVGHTPMYAGRNA